MKHEQKRRWTEMAVEDDDQRRETAVEDADQWTEMEVEDDDQKWRSKNLIVMNGIIDDGGWETEIVRVVKRRS